MENERIEPQKNPIQVSERIFSTIECLAQNGSMGLQELSTALSLNKSTVHRILNSLICMDYVRQDAESSRYSLSFKICGLANQILSKNNMIDIARPYLKELSSISGETVHLVQMDGINATYIDKVEASKNSIRMISMVGKSIPLYCSGVGKAMLADLSNEKIYSIWNRSSIEQLTPYTITNYCDFLQLIDKTRASGYAMDNEENELGVRCIAVALRGYNGKSEHAISISAPKDRMSDSRISELKELILKAKKQIEQKLKAF
ncbi:IclR family transcriptional regulator [Faecalimonas sp.]